MQTSSQERANASLSPQAGVSDALAADGGAQRHPDPG